MKILYFDCIGGISADMILGSCLDAGLKFSALKQNLKKLDLKKYVFNYSITKRIVHRNHFHAVKVDVDYRKRVNHPLSLNQIQNLINKSGLNKDIKELSLGIYERLAEAERKAHYTKAKNVKFQQLGDIDSIIDIVGVAVAIKQLKIEEFYTSAIPLGRNLGPATLRLIENLPLYFTDIPFENVTPTAAAVLNAVDAKPIVDQSIFEMDMAGYGAGTNKYHRVANVLRVIIGQRQSIFQHDRVTVIQTNIDDMNPQNFEYLQESLLKAGALDVYFQPVNMKKSRIGILLTVITKPDQIERMSGIIFRETPTLGIRYHDVNRKIIERRSQRIKTKFGNVKVKLGKFNGSITNITPEYEDCKILARRSNQPLRKIYETAKLEGVKKWL